MWNIIIYIVTFLSLSFVLRPSQKGSTPNTTSGSSMLRSSSVALLQRSSGRGATSSACRSAATASSRYPTFRALRSRLASHAGPRLSPRAVLTNLFWRNGPDFVSRRWEGDWHRNTFFFFFLMVLGLTVMLNFIFLLKRIYIE